MTLDISSPIPVVRLIIPDRTGSVLLLRRTNTKYGEGSWCLPGGKIDYGQTIEQAIAKELQEETSLVCESSHFLFYQDGLSLEEGKMHCINLYFECTVSGKIILNDESGEYAWIGKDDINKHEIAFRNDEALLKYWGEKRK